MSSKQGASGRRGQKAQAKEKVKPVSKQASMSSLNPKAKESRLKHSFSGQSFLFEKEPEKVQINTIPIVDGKDKDINFDFEEDGNLLDTRLMLE